MPVGIKSIDFKNAKSKFFDKFQKCYKKYSIYNLDIV